MSQSKLGRNPFEKARKAQAKAASEITEAPAARPSAAPASRIEKAVHWAAIDLPAHAVVFAVKAGALSLSALRRR